MNTKVLQEDEAESGRAAAVRPHAPQSVQAKSAPGKSLSGNAGGAGAGARLKDRYQIWSDAALPHLDSPSASAYAVTDQMSGNEGHFALVGHGDVLHREDAMTLLADVKSTTMLRLVEYGRVWWPRDNCRRLVAIFDRPAGARVMDSLSSPVQPMSELQAIRSMLAPLIASLSYLSVIGVMHRAIRPTNMYFSDSARQSILLGECVMSPPAFHQPSMFETVESSMTHPAGRGAGTRGDDIYALGVSLLYLLLGRNPMPGTSDREILASKLAQGSFTALVARAPIPTAMREPLRGMLQDDPKQRWDLDDLQGWVSERRLKPVQVLQNERAQRPFGFEGQNYYTCRNLASAVAQNWRSGTLADRKVELASWIERSLGDQHRREAVERAYDNRFVNVGGSGESAARAMLNARLVQALDPNGPLRYKGYASMIDGMGPHLAAHFDDPNALQEFNEVVRGGLPIFWVDMQRNSSRETSNIVLQFRRLNNFLRDPRPGYGYERCLYEMNPGQHCLSPLVEREAVVKIGELLPALEKIAKGMSEGMPFDRHLAAFIAARAEGDFTQALTMIGSRANALDAAMGLLSLYAALQWRNGPESLPELTRWIMAGAEPLLTNYHHRSARKRAEAELPRVLQTGSIVGLYNFLFNGDLRKQDEAGFAEAALAHSKAESEIAFLESGGASNPGRAREMGQRVAALFTVAIAVAAVVLITLAKF